MYITDFICTYKQFEDEVDSDDMYRAQYLQAFGINEYNFKMIDKTLEDLFFYFKNDNNGKEILNHLIKKKDKYYFLDFVCINQTNKNNYEENNEQNNLEELSNIFFILFCYDLFDLTHNCLNDLFNNGSISDKNTNLLIKEIEK